MKIKQKKKSTDSPSVNREQDFLPIEKIEYGVVKQKDGRYVKILEVEPCEYIATTPDIQWNMVNAFTNLFESSCINLHIKIKNEMEDITPFIESVNQKKVDVSNKYVNERRKDFIETTKAIASTSIKKQCYYFIFSYEGNSTDELEILTEFQKTTKSYADALNNIGCSVIDKSITDTDYPFRVLYSHLNPKSSLTETIEDRHIRVSSDYAKYNKAHLEDGISKEFDAIDVIAPRGIDFTVDTQFMVIDGMYKTFLVLRGNSLPQQLASDFVNALLKYDCEVDIFTSRLSTSKVLSSMKSGEKTRLITSTAKEGDVDTSKEEDDYSYYSTLNYIRRALLDEEHYYETLIVISFTGESISELTTRLDTFKARFGAHPLNLHFRDTYCNTEELFLMTLPLMCYKETSQLFKMNSRGFLTSSFVALMPFGSKDFKDSDGTIWGINLATNGLLAVDLNNRNMGFQNMNMAFVGGTGAGKSFTQMMLGSRFYLNGCRTFYVCPIKGHEYQWFCKSLNGTFINLLPQADCINLFEIRPEVENRLTKSLPLVSKKIAQIVSFFKLSLMDITELEVNKLGIALMGLYASFGITIDNDSIYDENNQIKVMPTFSDFVNYISNYPELQRVSVHTDKYINGIWSNLNGQTNVDLTKKCIVINCDEESMDKESLPAVMFLAVITLYDIVKSSKSLDILNIDEVWKCLKTKSVAEIVEEMARVIRGYQGALFVATQDIDSFLKDPTGKTILNLCDTKILKKMKGSKDKDNTEVCIACDTLGLPRFIYVPILTGMPEREALVILPSQEVHTYLYSSYSERVIYGTDDKSLARRDYLIKHKGWGDKTFNVTLSDMEELIMQGLASEKDLA